MSAATTIRVGPAPNRWQAQGLYLDGQRPLPAPVAMQIDELARALVAQGDGIDLRWPLADIRELPDQAGGDLLILRRHDDPLARLVLPDRSLVPRLINRTSRAPVTRRGPLLAWAVAAVAAVALIILVLVPRMADQLAAFIPAEGERALGQTALNQVRQGIDGASVVRLCEAPAGLAALREMETRLEAAMDEPLDLSIHVLDHGMVNAFALPGGFVVFFRGLIDKATEPEQIAAVFAHEVGHVVSRDPTRHALRSAGSIGVLGLLFGDFAGGTIVLFLTEQLINAKYSQGAEAQADRFAFEVLPRMGVSPAALADMFERFGTSGGEPPAIVRHFLSHPALGDRIEAAREAVPAGFEARPLMSETEWKALKSVCK
ncbi:MAG: M48 family metallopeptidase [Roseivivax sp.]|nr:M48 family metallopeptidase [Roseivivax sp.]